MPKSGILGDKTMDNKFLDITNDDKQNYLFCSSKLLTEKFGTNWNQSNFNKFTLIRSRCYKTLGTSVINSPMSTISLANIPKYIDRRRV